MLLEVRPDVVDGKLLKWMVAASVHWLEHHKQQVNNMNVFPVPDGDTGTNMLLTIRKAYQQVANSDESHAGIVFEKIARGALTGARGNSGTILSMLLRGFSLRFMWAMELFAVLVALVIIVVLVNTTWENFLRAWQLGDSTIDIGLPIWPTKLLVPVVLAILTVRLVLQILDYMRLVRHPDAVPIAVPVIETIEVQAQHEIEEALGREEKRP